MTQRFPTPVPLEVIYQAVDDGITVQDSHGRLVFANPRAAELLGYDSPESLLAVPPTEVVERFELLDEAGVELPLSELPGRRVLSGEQVPEVLMRFRRRESGSEQWAVVHARPISDEHGTIQFVINIFRNITDRKQAEEERARLLLFEHQARARAEEAQQKLAFLAEAGTVLASSLDYQTTLVSVAQLAVPRLGDWCAIHIVETSGVVHQLAVAHEDPAKVALARDLEQKYPFDPDAPTGAARVLRTGQAELVPEITDDLLAEIDDAELLTLIRELGLSSSMVVPLQARDQILGAITLVSAESGRRYGDEDLRLAEELANRAALAVDNARLYRASLKVAAEQEAILAQMTDGVLMADASGQIRYVNESGRRLLGMTEESEALQSYIRLTETLTPEGEEVSLKERPLTRALQGEVIVNAERRVRRLDGAEAVIQSSSSPLVAADGTLLGAVSVFRDVTAVRELELQKDDFLNSAAHDLKSPLATAKGLAQLLRLRVLRDGTPEASPIVEGLGKIDHAITRMTGLVNELLDLSRIQMGRPLDLNTGETALVDMLRRVADGVSTDRHAVMIHAALGEMVGAWDEERLERVFGNLLENAMKYSPDGGDVVVTATPESGDDGSWAVVTIQDHGLGIPADDVPHVFERFYRARNVASLVPGTGIGLAGAKQIVEQHGGSISVESSEGEGSTFTVRLPLSVAPRRP